MFSLTAQNEKPAQVHVKKKRIIKKAKFGL